MCTVEMFFQQRIFCCVHSSKEAPTSDVLVPAKQLEHTLSVVQVIMQHGMAMQLLSSHMTVANYFILSDNFLSIKAILYKMTVMYFGIYEVHAIINFATVALQRKI